jgi:hypothetical protein
VFTGDVDSAGYRVGDTIPAFTLYSTDDKRVNVSCVLKKDKPVLLVSGSYTCPHFRRFADDIDSMVRFYKDQLSVYVVYTLEAHPDSDPAPYANSKELEKNVAHLNHLEDIYCKQPLTYGDRKKEAKNMDKDLDLDAHILLDNAKNDWWEHFGPAPNIAYLVNPNGVIVAKNAWFNDSEGTPTMWCSIDKLLGTHSGMCKH